MLRLLIFALVSTTLAAQVQVDDVLGWLPANTETVVVAQEPFRLPHDSDKMTTAQAFTLGLLVADEKEELWKTLQGHTIRFAVLAARKFANHSPDGGNGLPLGMIAYQGCVAYVLASPLTDPPVPRPPEEFIVGQRVWLYSGKQYVQKREASERTDTYRIALPKADTILVCNDRDFFSDVLSRMPAPQGPPALPPSLPEWKHVDRSAGLWAIRHFFPDRARIDPTHPGNPLNEVKDAEATGMIVQIGAAGRGIKARWISNSSADPWRSFVFRRAQSRRVSDGVWELSVAGRSTFAVFVLMAMLGFEVRL